MNYFALICFSLIFLISCKKDKAPCATVINTHLTGDTIKPSNYIMAYPGSWWEYDNNVTITCGDWKESFIQTAELNGNCLILNQNFSTIPSSLNYFPMAGDLFFDKLVINNNAEEASKIVPLIDTVVGKFYDSGELSGDYDRYTYHLSEKLPSLEVQGIIYEDVLNVTYYHNKHFWKFPQASVYSYNKCYFAKNVGLIKQIYRPMGGGSDINSPHDTLEIVNHYIAPH